MKTPHLIKASCLALFISFAVSARSQDVTMEEKVEKIIFPVVQFKDATLEQALEYVRVKSRDLDTISQPPVAKGVSIVLRGGGFADPISLDLRDAPLIEVVRYCAERAGLQ